mgnify:CR=1 FL=1
MKKSYHKLRYLGQRRKQVKLIPGRFVEMSAIMMAPESCQIMAKTSIVGSHLRKVKMGTDSLEVIVLAESIEKRIDCVLAKRSQWEATPARVQLAVREIKKLFAGVSDVPTTTFRSI